jgi:hypothetical protein
VSFLNDSHGNSAVRATIQSAGRLSTYKATTAAADGRVVVELVSLTRRLSYDANRPRRFFGGDPVGIVILLILAVTASGVESTVAALAQCTFLKMEVPVPL